MTIVFWRFFVNNFIGSWDILLTAQLEPKLKSNSVTLIVIVKVLKTDLVIGQHSVSDGDVFQLLLHQIIARNR